MKYIIILLALLVSVSVNAQSEFRVDRSDMTDILEQKLKSIYENEIKGKDIALIKIEGHTDSRYTEEYNMALSERRAQTAADFLVGLGVDHDLIEIEAKGKTMLISSGKTKADHDKNRRVMVTVSVNEPVVAVCEEQRVYKKNIISITATSVITDYTIEQHPGRVVVENERKVVPGLMYQRFLTESLVLGGTVNTNKDLGVNLGFAW